ncbi:MAG TPA: hypothetical protein VMR52_10055 [Dehalococcoidia bacterium]|nr:hypothetical protein [Dehalococcoidia bacterium]
MTKATSALISQTASFLGQDTVPVLEELRECPNSEWYLREKIVKADHDSRRNNTRVLKYAAMLVKLGAAPAFIRETVVGKSPDLRAAWDGTEFFIEVKNFPMLPGAGSSHAAAKIADAIVEARSQLPLGAPGLVAIDNFNPRLEPAAKYQEIESAFSEVERRARENPDRWQQPGGVILSACSYVGARPMEPPDYLWSNPVADPSLPEQMMLWLKGGLTNVRRYRPGRSVN